MAPDRWWKLSHTLFDKASTHLHNRCVDSIALFLHFICTAAGTTTGIRPDTDFINTAKILVRKAISYNAPIAIDRLEVTCDPSSLMTLPRAGSGPELQYHIFSDR